MTTKSAGNWLREVRRLRQTQELVLSTRTQFEEHLAALLRHPESPIRAVSIVISRADPFSDVSIGPIGVTDSEGLGPSTEVTTHALADADNSRCRVEIWNTTPYNCHDSSSYAEPAEVVEELISLIAEFWKGPLRDDKSRIISMQYPQVNSCAEASLLHYLRHQRSACVIFCDLDKFKKVNDELGEAKGDEVILHLSAVLEAAVGKTAVALHRSGDEFIILYPGATPDEALLLTRTVMDAVSNHDFDVGDIPVALSAGIAVATEGGDVPSYKDVEHLAEKSFKLEGGDKLRGVARLSSTASATTAPLASDFSLAKALCVVKSNPGCPRPFYCPWLNLVSQTAYRTYQEVGCDPAGIAQAVADLIEWIRPDFEPGRIRAALSAEEMLDRRPVLSPVDLAFAVAHGVGRGGLLADGGDLSERSLRIQYDPNSHESCRLQLLPDEADLLTIGDITQATEEHDLGGFLCFERVESAELDSARRALLIKVGHGHLTLRDSMFADVLVVDDRPTRGGVLPDFWEATIARLVSRVTANPNVAWVYVVGNQDYAAETVERLRDLDCWVTNAEHLSYKTGMAAKTIRDAASALQGKVRFLASEEELVRQFAEDLRSSAVVPPLKPPQVMPARSRFLQRQLRLDAIALKDHDGCRVDTIAQAFPVVLEIARRMPPDAVIRDQAGQELTELLDFRVHLSDPEKDRVPAFYEKEADSLRAYEDRAFLKEDSFFGSRIGQQQIDAVIQHVSSAIGGPVTRFATRRAVLIVPHEVRPNEDLAPLGLISVRIVPRFHGGRIVLHYSFTWRTVEALVGFPYSLYGSVGYAQHLTGLVKDTVEDQTARHVELGEVSYIAHSLHMFMDDYGQNIARRIVDDASV